MSAQVETILSNLNSQTPTTLETKLLSDIVKFKCQKVIESENTRLSELIPAAQDKYISDMTQAFESLQQAMQASRGNASQRSNTHVPHDSAEVPDKSAAAATMHDFGVLETSSAKAIHGTLDKLEALESSAVKAMHGTLDRLDALETNTTESMQSALSRIDRLETGSKDTAKDTVDKLEQLENSSAEAIENSSAEAMHGTLDRLEQLENSSAEAMHGTLDRLEQLESSSAEAMHGTRDRLDKLEQSSTQASCENLDKLNTLETDVAKALQKTVNKIKSVDTRAKSRTDKVSDNYSNIVSDLQAQITTLGDTNSQLAQNLSLLDSQSVSAFHSLIDDIEELKAKYSEPRDSYAQDAEMMRQQLAQVQMYIGKLTTVLTQFPDQKQTVSHLKKMNRQHVMHKAHTTDMLHKQGQVQHKTALLLNTIHNTNQDSVKTIERHDMDIKALVDQHTDLVDTQDATRKLMKLMAENNPYDDEMRRAYSESKAVLTTKCRDVHRHLERNARDILANNSSTAHAKFAHVRNQLRQLSNELQQDTIQHEFARDKITDLQECINRDLIPLAARSSTPITEDTSQDVCKASASKNPTQAADTVAADTVTADTVAADTVAADTVAADTVAADTVAADTVTADSVPLDTAQENSELHQVSSDFDNVCIEIDPTEPQVDEKLNIQESLQDENVTLSDLENQLDELLVSDNDI
jgi:hypothetical protein